MKDLRPLLAYAYELQPGDEVDGRIVRAVTDPHRPTHGGKAYQAELAPPPPTVRTSNSFLRLVGLSAPVWMRRRSNDAHGPAVIHFDGSPSLKVDRLEEFPLLRPERVA